MLLFLLLLAQISHSCDALVLTKLARAYHYYSKNEKSKIGLSAYDPLDDFRLPRRVQLCDDVLNAKQFMTKYPASKRKHVQSGQKVQLTEWNLPPGVPNSVLNFQRSISSGQGGEDSAVLQYKQYHIRLNGGAYRTLKRIQCVRTATIDWFVTYGLVDNTMYLIEYNKERKNKSYRMVGILEENPLLDDRGFEHFQSQYEKYRDEMESICLLGFDDIMRLCSAVLDTLDNLGSLRTTVRKLNYLEYQNQRCIMKGIQMNGVISQQYFLRCSFFLEHDEKPTPMFYTLADSSKEGAAFVFFEEEYNVLRLHTRMVQIGALVNPTGTKKVKLITEAEFTGGKGRIIPAENESSGSGHASTIISWREDRQIKYEIEQRSRMKQTMRKTRGITPKHGSSYEENTIMQEKSEKQPNKEKKKKKRMGFEKNVVEEEEEEYNLSNKGEKIVQQNVGYMKEDSRDLEISEEEES